MGSASEEQLRWNQLRKQSLLDEKPRDFYQVIKEQLGLHSTDYWTPYLSVWSRIGDYDAEKMFKSIDNGMQLVRTHAFRTTIHLIHIDNLSVILSATGPALFNAYRTDRYRKMDQLSDRQIEEMMNQVKKALKDGPLQTSELKRIVPEVGERVRSALLMLMARGEVVRAKAKHARSNLTSYALLDRWVKGFKLEIIDEQEAISHVIQSHLERFGPASVDDIAWWLKQTKTTVKNVLADLDEGIVRLEIGGTEKFMWKGDMEIAASLEAPSEDLVWFLPYEDHFLKAFIDRTPFLDEDIQDRLFPADRRMFWPSDSDTEVKMPSKGIRTIGEVRPSIWLNGQVVGRWEIDDDGDVKRVVTSLYIKASRQQQSMVEQVRGRLEEFINSSLMPISS